MKTFGERMANMLTQLEHDIEGLVFIFSDDAIVVEGSERGVLISGDQFPDGEVSQGRVCNGFRFKSNQIASVHIYADPDFGSEDADRIWSLRGALNRNGM